jgi:Type II secretory pathway, prepilin signal peptidase PulO and related peptidases
MDVAWVAAGAVAGLVAGTALRGTVFRLAVPHGAADRTTCPHCAAAVRRRPLVRCGGCHGRLGVPFALELATAVVLALLLARFGGQPDVVAFAFLGVLGVALVAIDIAVERLPDRLTLPAYPVLIALLGVAAAVEQDGAALLRALLGGVAMGGCFLVLALLRAGQLGGGDVKAAGLVGLALGWLGWPTLLVGATLGFVLMAVVSVVLLAARRITLRSSISFGPFLMGGALLAILGTG